MMANRMISVLLLLLLPAVCQSFNNLVGNIVSKVSKVPKEAPRDTETTLLEEFGLDSSSTEPKPFSARPQQIPALLTASLPVRARTKACNNQRLYFAHQNPFVRLYFDWEPECLQMATVWH